MKKLLLCVFIIIFCYVEYARAQQLSLYSQYLMNDVFINPAIAGTKNYDPLVLSIHKQWVGIENSPSSQTLSYHKSIDRYNIGLGGILFNDTFGPEGHMGLQFLMSYRLHIDRVNKISFGLSAIAMQYKLDQRYFAPSEYDPSLTYQIEKTFIPDASIGVYFYGERYYAGITGAHLFQSKLRINDNIKENKMVRHYFLIGGYKFSLAANDLWIFEPSVLLKFTEISRPQFDINAKFYYNKNFWFGFSLRPNDSFIANVGFKYNQYYIAYSYDFTFSNLSRHTFGSQEIVFGINFNENTSRTQRTFF